MTAIQPFAPKLDSTVALSPGVASATAVVDPDKSCKQLRFINTGANICYVRTFNSANATEAAKAATAVSFPIAANSVTTITKHQTNDSIAYISALGTTLLVTPGEGF